MAHLPLCVSSDQENSCCTNVGKHRRDEPNFQDGGFENVLNQKRRALASLTNQHVPKASLSLSQKSCGRIPIPSSGPYVSVGLYSSWH